MGMDMSKSIVLLLVLVFLTASCVFVTIPVSAVSEDSWVTKAPMQQARFGLRKHFATEENQYDRG
jgi:hypothetical protein